MKKIGGSFFKGIHILFHHHRVQAIYQAVDTFKKYHSKLKIGKLLKIKAYCDLHISKVSLYGKLNKAWHKFGNHMNHKAFLLTIKLGIMKNIMYFIQIGEKVLSYFPSTMQKDFPI